MKNSLPVFALLAAVAVGANAEEPLGLAADTAVGADVCRTLESPPADAPCLNPALNVEARIDDLFHHRAAAA